METMTIEVSLLYKLFISTYSINKYYICKNKNII